MYLFGASSAATQNQVGPMPAVNPDGSAANSVPFGVTPDGNIITNNNLLPGYDQVASYLRPQAESIDLTWKTIYDDVALNSAANQSYNFFQNPNNTNQFDSNVIGGQGQLPGQEAMIVRGVKFTIENDVTTAPLNMVTVKEILRQMYWQIWVGNKFYLDGDGMLFWDNRAYTVVNTNYYGFTPTKAWDQPLDIPIPPLTQIYVKTSWVNPTLSNNWKMKCYLIGAYYRGVQ